MLSKLKNALIYPRDVLSKERRAEVERIVTREDCYIADDLIVAGRNVSFINDKKFSDAYAAGINSGHKLAGTGGKPLNLQWRVHMCCWAARHASRLEGDFVECGVNTGIFSLAVCNFLDFNQLDKTFFLFDTFSGIPEKQMSESEYEPRRAENQLMYEECYDLAKSNFSGFPNVRIVKGEVPESLDSVDIERVAYLSLDMNIARPEIAALNHYWDKLVTGAIVILDDYGWLHYREQYDAVNVFAAEHDVMVATLPTGQGLIIKP